MSGIVVLILRILMLVAIYSFLGLGLFLLWQDLRVHLRGGIPANHPIIQIKFLHNGNNLDCLFKQNEILVGREAGVDLLLNDDTVSSRHARITYHQKQWWVEDLQSTNGTYLNNELVQMATVIMEGDKIRCGVIEFSIHVEQNENA